MARQKRWGCYIKHWQRGQPKNGGQGAIARLARATCRGDFSRQAVRRTAMPMSLAAADDPAISAEPKSPRTEVRATSGPRPGSQAMQSTGSAHNKKATRGWPFVFAQEKSQSPRYSQPLVQVSWMRTRLSSGSSGLSCCQIHLASTSLVGFSRPGMSCLGCRRAQVQARFPCACTKPLYPRRHFGMPKSLNGCPTNSHPQVAL